MSKEGVVQARSLDLDSVERSVRLFALALFDEPGALRAVEEREIDPGAPENLRRLGPRYQVPGGCAE